jgi:hypothetical protein
MNDVEKQIVSCFCKKERFKFRDLVTFQNGKLHIHKFVPNDATELSAKFEAKCKKCGYIQSHNW